MIFFFIIAFSNTDLFETEEPKDFEVIISDLENLMDNPIDINTADLQQFLKIPFLKIADCLRIIGYREKYGLFESIDDLYKIKGLDKGLIEQLRPFITLKTKPLKWKGLQNRLRLQRTLKEDSDNEYYTRTTLNINDYKIFLTTEKDPYERSFFDYYSPGILIDEGKRKFAFGKYNLDYGLGIMLSSVGSFFQGLDFRLLTTERGIIPYTSTIENGGFFGAAVSDSLLLNYCLFYSNQRLDGTIDTAGYARSFDESGKHIDSASIARKDRIREEIFGYNIEYRKNDIFISNRTYWSNYEPPFVCEDSLNKFYGGDYWITGLGIKYFAENFIIFGEFARSFQNRLGGILGWSGLMPYNFEFNLAAKYFEPGFYAPKAQEAENNHISATFDINNRSHIINAGTTINIYTDNATDTNNYDLRLNLNRRFGFVESRIQLRWLYSGLDKRLAASKVFSRFQPKKSLYFDLRLEEKYVHTARLIKGLFGGIEFGVEKWIIKPKIRYALFDIGSYAARMYVYEPDLPGIVNNRMLYGKGNYKSIYLKAEPLKNFHIGIKYFALEKDTLTQHIGIQFDTRF